MVENGHNVGPVGMLPVPRLHAEGVLEISRVVEGT